MSAVVAVDRVLTTLLGQIDYFLFLHYITEDL